MRKIFAVLLILIMILSGCSSKEKITVIKGPGNANSSLMNGLNELCAGNVEGYAENKLIISKNNGNNIEFYSVDTLSADSKLLLSAFRYNDYYFKMSGDGKKFLYENYLVDVENSMYTLMPDVEVLMPQVPAGFPHIADYSFNGGSDVVYLNPFYYINKYYKKKVIGFKGQSGNQSGLSYLKLGDIKDTKDTKGNKGYPLFTDIKVPDIDYIKNGELLWEQLKYLFIGHKKGTEQTPLYVFDFVDKKFNLIDSNVKSYFLAPDNKTIAYVKKIDGERVENKLAVSTIDGEEQKTLATSQEITGLAWSGDCNWIAYTGGEKNKRDVYILKSDGSKGEQLTRGMNPAGKLAWIKSGNEIAFSSDSEGLEGKQTVYIITMNMNTTMKSGELEVDPLRKGLYDKLNEIIKVETDVVRKNSKIQ